SRLLIIACSARKRAAAGLLPAIERYDGPAFQVLRKYRREHPDGVPAVLILSARYGLIPAARKIPDYDLRLTAEAADQLRPAVLRRLGAAIKRNAYLELCFCLGRQYRRALAGYQRLLPAGLTVTSIGGGLGPR